MATLKTLLTDARSLPLEDRQRLVRELARANLIDLLRSIEADPVDPLPVSDQELQLLVHEARRKVLRARGL
jgi:hypothetical protein